MHQHEPPLDFPACLHTVLVTDGVGDLGRLRALVDAVLAGGIQTVHLREPTLTAVQLGDLCAELRAPCRAHRALLVVHDRADLAAAGLCGAVHLGFRSLPPARVRSFVPPTTRISAAVHDAAEVQAASAADYLLLSPLFPTRSKPGAAALGDAAGVLLALSAAPVVLLGGIDLANAARARRIGGVGIAVMRAVCAAADPEVAARALVATRDHDRAR
jgi:thiamine-phosphate pyrophosphorylase